MPNRDSGYYWDKTNLLNSIDHLNLFKDVFEGRFAKISGENPGTVSSFGRVRKRNRSLDDDFLDESDEEDLLGSSLFKQR